MTVNLEAYNNRDVFSLSPPPPFWSRESDIGVCRAPRACPFRLLVATALQLLPPTPHGSPLLSPTGTCVGGLRARLGHQNDLLWGFFTQLHLRASSQVLGGRISWGSLLGPCVQGASLAHGSFSSKGPAWSSTAAVGLLGSGLSGRTCRLEPRLLASMPPAPQTSDPASRAQPMNLALPLLLKLTTSHTPRFWSHPGRPPGSYALSGHLATL